MKAPAFWFRDRESPGWAVRMLYPFSLIWLFFGWLRRVRSKPHRATVPVLCIGNLTAGGGGKSPMVAALQQRLAQKGIGVHVLSKGYGGRIKGPHLVDGNADRFTDVGDEPLMLSANGAVWIARNRVLGAKAAEAAGADLILLDDGFQDPALLKDAAILMVDAGQGYGNGRVIPAGPLRETVASGHARADLTVVLGPSQDRHQCRETWPELTMLSSVDASLVPMRTGLPLQDEEVIAFAGIARPEKFFDTLREMGAHLLATHAFGDHEPFRPAILRRLIRESREVSAILVTTEKDAVRLPRELRTEILTVQVRLEPDDWAPIDALIDRLLPGRVA